MSAQIAVGIALLVAQQVLAPIITAYLIFRTGSYVTAFFLVAAILVVGAVSYLFLVPPLTGDRARAVQT